MLVLDVNKIINKINILFLVLSLFLGITFAQTQTQTQGGLTDLKNAMSKICGDVRGLLAPVAMLLIIAGAVTYAAGQFAGAEMRAKSTSWATAMIIGALFAFILVLFLPGVIVALFTGDQNQNWTDYCSV